jgi:hypothetical protein
MLIRDVASRAITGLKTKADETYTRMYDWLGEKYKQETESIENMAKIIRYAIESKEKIEQQLVLDKYTFYIAEVNKYIFFSLIINSILGCCCCSTTITSTATITYGTNNE